MSEPATPRVRDRLAVAAFVLLFWLPMLARSTVLHAPLPGSPAVLNKLHAIACLFTDKPQAWNTYFVQVRYDARNVWVDLDVSESFSLEPFGRRTRMHRLLVAWQPKPSKKHEELARWLLVREAVLHPDRPQPIAIRFARGWTIPDPEHPPQHGWRAPTWLELPPRNRRVFATYTRDELLGGAR
jgi:hypothetical protein